jgi:hypothetical protein
MELGSTWEAMSYVAKGFFPSTLQNLEVHYLIHSSSPLVPILNQTIHPPHTIYPKSNLNIIRPPTTTRTPSQLSLSLWLSYQKPTRIPLFPHSYSWPTLLILFNLIIRILLGEVYKSWSSSICSFLHSHITSSHFSPSILLNALFSNILSLCSSLNIKHKVSHTIRILYNTSILTVS